MKHIHLDKTESTQTELKRLVEGGEFNDNSLLISTDFQDNGFGRQGSQWKHFPGAIAFSFTLEPNEVLTLSPLEIGVHLSAFFGLHGAEIKLKWPNDILNPRKEKLGGILCQLYNKTLMVGVGINLVHIETHEMPYPINGIFPAESSFIKDYNNIHKEIPKVIYEYILSNRLSPNEVREQFVNQCIHNGIEVSITDNEHKEVGKFKGIGENGEAILESKDYKDKKILTGSLRF